MRSAVVALSLLLVPSLAAAESVAPGKPPIVMNRQPHTTVARTPAGTTSISHVIFINSCMPNGCTLTGDGQTDDAANHITSLIGNGANVHLSPYPGSPTEFQTLVDCMRDTYLPFDLTIVSERPTSGTYSEIIAAGHAAELSQGGADLSQAGGVAPFIDCQASTDNAISYMFAADNNNLNYLCGGVAQETSHVFGLSHELNADDPMTYLNLGSHKTFQNALVQCGEDLSAPHACQCTGQGGGGSRQMQNSYNYLMQTFGPLVLTAASMSIDDPKEGAWVKPGFSVHPVIVDQLSLTTATLTIDGATAGSKTVGPYTFGTAGSVAPGDHAITITAMDKATPPRTISATVNVHVLGACSAQSDCADGTGCVAGFCYPDASVDGGNGATCTANEMCIGGQCGTDGTKSLCTGACTADRTCPSGQDCLDDGGAGICWPSTGGGCNIGGGRGSLVLFVGLGFALFARRRRR